MGMERRSGRKLQTKTSRNPKQGKAGKNEDTARRARLMMMMMMIFILHPRP
jgi:hypothetical protein